MLSTKEEVGQIFCSNPLDQSWFELCRLLSNPALSTHELLDRTIDLIPTFYENSTNVVASLSMSSEHHNSITTETKQRQLSVDIPSFQFENDKRTTRQINILHQGGGCGGDDNDDEKAQISAGDTRVKLIAQLLGQAIDCRSQNTYSSNIEQSSDKGCDIVTSDYTCQSTNQVSPLEDTVIAIDEVGNADDDEDNEEEEEEPQDRALAKAGQWELDLAKNELSWSDEIFQLFQVDKTKFAASYEAFLNAIHPDDRDLVNNSYTTSLQTEEDYDITHRLLYPDGQIKIVREVCRTEYDVGTGNPLRSIGLVQDITNLANRIPGVPIHIEMPPCWGKLEQYNHKPPQLLEDDHRSFVSEITDPDGNDDDASAISTGSITDGNNKVHSNNNVTLRVQWGGSTFYTIERRQRRCHGHGHVGSSKFDNIEVPLVEDRFGTSDLSTPWDFLPRSTTSVGRRSAYSSCDGSDDRAPRLPRRNSCPETAWDVDDENVCYDSKRSFQTYLHMHYCKHKSMT